jgi:hypothetical protein
MLKRVKFGVAILSLAGSLLVGGCAGTGIGTPCGGSHGWPPNGLGPAPAGLSVALVSGTTVRVRNDTDRSWFARVAAWKDLGCVGYEAAEPASQQALGPHDTVEVAVVDPVGWTGQLRIGVEFWDHACGSGCQDQPTGFGFVDAATSSSPT